MKTKTLPPAASRVLEFEAADPKTAEAHFSRKLALETDPSDVHADLARGEAGFVLVDARAPEAYAREHLPGAVNLWHRTIDRTTAGALPKDKLLVVYCTDVACNASAKGALKLSRLGFRVKEMVGGIGAWRQEGYPTEKA